MQTPAVEGAIGNFLVVMIGKGAPSPCDTFVEEDGVVLRFKPPDFHPALGTFLTPWITFWRSRRYDSVGWEDDPRLDEVITHARELEKRDLQDLT